MHRELEQLQNEKRKALVEHEQAKLSEIDERLKAELRDWREQLVPRKQVCIMQLLLKKPVPLSLIPVPAYPPNYPQLPVQNPAQGRI